MIFINAVINKPNDLDYRIHLRNEFYASGFGNILEVFFFFFFFFSILFFFFNKNCFFFFFLPKI